RDLDPLHPEQGRAPAREPEEPLEAERQIEVAARVQAALGERVEPGEPSLAQGEPGRRVASDHDVGVAHRRRADLAAGSGGPHLPGPADVSEPHLEGGVEAALGAEVAAGERRERLLYAPQAPLLERDRA